MCSNRDSTAQDSQIPWNVYTYVISYPGHVECMPYGFCIASRLFHLAIGLAKICSLFPYLVDAIKMFACCTWETEMCSKHGMGKNCAKHENFIKIPSDAAWLNIIYYDLWLYLFIYLFIYMIIFILWFKICFWLHLSLGNQCVIIRTSEISSDSHNCNDKQQDVIVIKDHLWCLWPLMIFQIIRSWSMTENDLTMWRYANLY